MCLRSSDTATIFSSVAPAFSPCRTGATEEKIVAVSVETKTRLSPFSARHIGSAEKQRPEGSLDLRRHVRPGASRSDGLFRSCYVHGLHEFLGAGGRNGFQIRGETFSADGGPGAFEESHAV